MNYFYGIFKISFIGLIFCFFLTLVLGKIIIPILKSKKIGQSIRQDGPKSHLLKEGTPTMGGIIFLIPIVFFSLVFALYKDSSVIVLVSLVLFTIVGFIDDFKKLILKQSEGLKEREKLYLQFIFAIIVLALSRFVNGDGVYLQHIPFIKQTISISPILYYPMMIFIIVGVVNAVNLTDGLDGLASGVSIYVFTGFAIIAAIQGGTETIISCIIIGSLMGFIIYNGNPASIYMGDTGSMLLGGAVVAISINLNIVFYLPILGGIYMIETLSVIIQTIYFRKTGGKRIFLMSPIHHHFELKGYKEQKIVSTFNMISLFLMISTITIYMYS